MKIQAGPVHAFLSYLRERLRADRNLLQMATADEIATGTHAAAPMREGDKGTIEVYAQELPAVCFSCETAVERPFNGFNGLDLRGQLWYVFRTPRGAIQPDGRAATGPALGLNWTLAVLERIHRAIREGQIVSTSSQEPIWVLADGGIDSVAQTGAAAIMAEGSDLCGFKLPVSLIIAAPPYTIQDPPAANAITATLTPYDDGTLGTGGTAVVVGPDVVLSEVTDGT